MAGQNRIELSTGQTVDVRSISGVVADDQNRSSTRIYSSGGGGYIGPHGGNVLAPEIHSETTTRQSIWVTDAGGNDHEILLSNARIPLRVGQRVTARFVQRTGSDQWHLATFMNHSAELFYTWADKSELPFDPMASYQGSVVDTALVLGGIVGCWYSYRQLSGSSSANLTLLWVGLMALAGLAVLSGGLSRSVRRAKLKAAIQREYVDALRKFD